MAFTIGDRVLETTITTGTGTITLAGAVSGYRAFSTIATVNGDLFYYTIAGGTEWEVGIGTRASSTTFTRSVLSSSNAGALVNFSAGTKEVWMDIPAAIYGAATVTTPTVTSGSGAFTTVASVVAKRQRGKYVSFSVEINITTNGTAATDIRIVGFASPVPVRITSHAGTKATSGTAVNGFIDPTTGLLLIFGEGGAYAGGNGVQIVTSGVYEVA
jgi:hypothetical protein